MSINIALLSAVSVGKSTLVNTLFCKTYNDIAIKRSTAQPQVYIETDIKITRDEEKHIYDKNKYENEKIMSDVKNTLTNIEERVYNVPKMIDIIADNQTPIAIYDMPGLNDSFTKAIYYQYIQTNFYKFDIIIFMIDISTALNTSDEIDILMFILENIKNKQKSCNIQTKLLVILNKCDEMIYNSETQQSMPFDSEELGMRQQVIDIINTKKFEIGCDIEIPIICASFEDAHSYRMYANDPSQVINLKYLTKIGINEYGKHKWLRYPDDKKLELITDMFNSMNIDARLKTCGFFTFKQIMNTLLTPKSQFEYVCNHLKYDLHNIKLINNSSMINEQITKFYDIYLEIEKYKMLYSLSGDDIVTYFKHVFNKFIKIYCSTMEKRITAKSRIKINTHKHIISCIHNIKTKFNDMFENHSDINALLVMTSKNLDSHYLDKLEDTTLDITQIIEIFTELEKEKYNIEKLKESFFLRLYQYDIFVQSEEKKLNFIKQVINYFNLDNHTILWLLFSCLNNYYLHKLQNKNIDAKDISDYKLNILNNIIIKTTNQHYNNFLKLKKYLTDINFYVYKKFDVYGSNYEDYKFTNCVEDILISILHKTYPDTIMHINEIIIYKRHYDITDDVVCNFFASDHKVDNDLESSDSVEE